MNLKDSLQNILNKINNYNDIDLAVIFTTYINCYGIKEFIPKKVVSGKYDEKSRTFITEQGESYCHLIDVMEGEGYMYRASVDIYRKRYPNIPDALIKRLFLYSVKQHRFNLALSSNKIPLIMFAKKNTNDIGKVVLDIELLAYYETFYPSFYNNIIKMANGEEIDVNLIPKEEEDKLEFSAKPINVKELYKEVTEKVIDQSEPIEQILTAIWKQYNNFDSNKSRNILIYGKSGVGKTEIFRIISQKLEIPYAIVNATDYTAVGYVGDSVSDMLIAVVNSADGDVKKAENGILIIDEIDKLSEPDRTGGQVNKKDVQQALLKILEDGTFYLNIGDKLSQTRVTFNTRNLLVIGMGSFSNIDLSTKKTVGFNSTSQKREYKDINTNDMMENGTIPELIGRFPVVVKMNELNKESFIKILTNVKSSVIAKNQPFFNNLGVKLLLQEGTINEIAEKAEKQATGARSLDEIVETALSKASFEIATNPNIYETLIITPETIKDNNKYTLVRRKADETKEKKL